MNKPCTISCWLYTVLSFSDWEYMYTNAHDKNGATKYGIILTLFLNWYSYVSFENTSLLTQGNITKYQLKRKDLGHSPTQDVLRSTLNLFHIFHTSHFVWVFSERTKKNPNFFIILKLFCYRRNVKSINGHFRSVLFSPFSYHVLS